VSDLIRDALARLSAALDRLDAVSLRHSEGDRARANLESELALMREDRHQLAAMMDQERSIRTDAEETLAAVSPRIDAAMQAIRAELGGGR
jgi:predicted  nucleic acid-binding Zn-ribbon protein